jgi:hypothetical protein
VEAVGELAAALAGGVRAGRRAQAVSGA